MATTRTTWSATAYLPWAHAHPPAAATFPVRHQVAACRQAGDTVSMSNLSQSTLEALACEYGLEIEALDARTRSPSVRRGATRWLDSPVAACGETVVAVATLGPPQGRRQPAQQV